MKYVSPDSANKRIPAHINTVAEHGIQSESSWWRRRPPASGSGPWRTTGRAHLPVPARRAAAMSGASGTSRHIRPAGDGAGTASTSDQRTTDGGGEGRGGGQHVRPTDRHV